jgi:hypothetical protein
MIIVAKYVKAIGAVVLIYLAFAFGWADFDITNWDMPARFMCAFVMMVVAIFILINPFADPFA